VRFESVRAHPFGPFHDETISLAPGLNVVFGPNEAGKSTWHAALYAGLCGMRRGKGAASAEARRFRDRHRPWDAGGAWAVSAVVALEDGRRVELHQNLASKVDCNASDADLAGRDYTNEILYEGAPDGSRWLGLNRGSFLGAACVRQAQVLRLPDDADALQEDLQRAAATAGADQTAARALDLLADYRREHVGSAQAPTKPLRTSRERVSTSRSVLERAQRAQAEYLERRLELEQFERQAEAREQDAAVLRAASAGQDASHAEARAARAAELSARLRDGPPRATVAGSGRRPTPPYRAAAPYLAAAGTAAGIALALADFLVPGLVAAGLGLAFLAWWRLTTRRAEPPAPDAPTGTAAEEQRLLADFRAEAVRLREEAASLAEQVAPAALAAVREVSPERLAAAERRARTARDACHRARGQLEQIAADLPSVADAEDDLTAARQELGRIERLDRTLATAIEFLERAEERVHRDFAPVLRATLLEWLPRVTGGRYTDCKVDPESLQVDVRTGYGPWRRAGLLSHGTAEQIYLLLRLALARHLVAPGEVCPLILDDVVAACDVERKQVVLETLQAVGATSQVILFTHEEDVRAWARKRLEAPRDALSELPRPRRNQGGIRAVQ